NPLSREQNRQTFPSCPAAGQARYVATAKRVCDGRLRKRSLHGKLRPMQELDELSERFWAWRARQQPRTRDDIPRLVRPRGWRPEVEAALAVQRREELGAFAAELALIRPDDV